MTTLSVVIPNLHSPRIGQVIAAILAQTAGDQICEVIVVGMDRYGLVQPMDGGRWMVGGGRYESPSIAYRPSIRHIETERPVSAAAARNRGATAASGEWLLFLDADCLLAPDAIEQLLAARDDYDALIGGVVLETGHYWELCNNLMTFPHNTEVDTAGSRPSLASFCLLMPRALWARIGGFDETWTIACEDMDLSMRLRRAGYHLGAEPAALVRHRPNRTTMGACYGNHRGYGWFWRAIRQTYPDQLGPSPALQATAESGTVGAALAVPFALAFAVRLLGSRRGLWRFWYTLPGLLLLRLAWYDGYRQSKKASAT